MTRSKKALAGAAVFGALVVAAGGSAFTASNQLPTSVVGNGSAVVTGATATSINYTLSADKSTVDAVHFVINPLIPAASVAELKLSGSAPYDSGWLACVTTDTTHIDCDTTGAAPLVADIENVALTVH